MEITLTAEQNAFVRSAVESGRLQNSEQAVQDAMTLWVERERRRVELLASLDAAEASLARGEGVPITQESMHALAEDIKRRGREHVAARDAARR